MKKIYRALKIPFINRKRYIELKCYSNTKFDIDNCPITLSSELPVMKPVGPVSPYVGNFSGCYGYIKGMKKSAVLRAWTEAEFEGLGSDEGISFNWADTANGLSNITIHQDPIYQSNTNILTKMTNPWRLEETTGVHFVTAKHITNLTPMAIPSGLLTFNVGHQLNVFNLVHVSQPKYKIKFKEPLLALYPMSDLPLHVECIFDPEKHGQLNNETNRRAYFKGNNLKLCRRHD